MKTKTTSRFLLPRSGLPSWKKSNFFRIGFFLFSLLLFWPLVSHGKKTTQPESPYHLACPYSRAIYTSQPVITKKFPAKAVIVPHHLLAKDLISQALGSISGNFETIILVGPNHKDAGLEPVQTSRAVWKTQFGDIFPAEDMIRLITAGNPNKLNENVFDTEHSVCGLVSFIRIYFPKATILPLIFKSYASGDLVRRTASVIASRCNNCLVIASTDFSHEVSQSQAEINDRKSIDILTNLEEENIGSVVGDSRSTLEFLLLYLKKSNASQAQLVGSTDSNRISGQNLPTVTSYVSLLFR